MLSPTRTSRNANPMSKSSTLSPPTLELLAWMWPTFSASTVPTLELSKIKRGLASAEPPLILVPPLIFVLTTSTLTPDVSEMTSMMPVTSQPTNTTLPLAFMAPLSVTFWRMHNSPAGTMMSAARSWGASLVSVLHTSAALLTPWAAASPAPAATCNLAGALAVAARDLACTNEEPSSAPMSILVLHTVGSASELSLPPPLQGCTNGI
mmetsp:Transcript_146911/g.366402  ORF Transcript_146911/g.366402 Transcript_146911/m.366402 type:complete len:208 (-) Transcript_146911:240-863(-)